MLPEDAPKRREGEHIGEAHVGGQETMRYYLTRLRTDASANQTLARTCRDGWWERDMGQLHGNSKRRKKETLT